MSVRSKAYWNDIHVITGVAVELL